MWAVILFLFFHFWDIIESFCINRIAIRKLNLFGFGIVREHKIEELVKYDSWCHCTLSSGIQPTEVALSQTLTPLTLFSLPIYFFFHLSPSLSIFLPQSSTTNSIFLYNNKHSYNVIQWYDVWYVWWLCVHLQIKWYRRKIYSNYSNLLFNLFIILSV